MDKKTYTLNTIFACVLGAALLVCVLVRTFAPRMILPNLDVPAMVLVSLVTLVLDYYLAPNAKRCYVCVAAFGTVTFGLLPYCAGFATGLEALLFALKGGITFTATTWLFGSMTDRISTGPAAKAAPVVSALGLYLAAQVFVGIF